jgi:hypothetical protein
MEKFTFRVEQLSTVWEEGWIEFEAANFDEAKKKAIDYVASEEHTYDVAPIYETIECMPLEKNYGNPTCILFHDPDEDKNNGFTEQEVWDNRPSTPEPPELPEEFQEMAKAINEFDESTKQFIEAVKAAGGTIVGCGKA